MIIALFPNELKAGSLKIASEIAQFLTERGVKVVTEDQHSTIINSTPLSTIDPTKIDFRLSLGGDGTILRLVHQYPEIKAPLLGINLGNLGFLADIPLHDIYPSLQELLDSNYTIQKRMMMEGMTSKGHTCSAVNEIVVHRAQNRCLINLVINVDNQYLNTFSADGIIISTPSGSTAYSLSAGGPILSPELDALVITPISPHTISNRPIVLLPKHQIEIRCLSPLLPLEVSYDGFSDFALEAETSFKVFPSKERFPLVNLARHDYFYTLREKLGWHGKLKNF